VCVGSGSCAVLWRLLLYVPIRVFVNTPYIHTQKHTWAHVHTHKHTHTHTHTHSHTHTSAHAHTHTLTYTHTLTRTHTHFNTCSESGDLGSKGLAPAVPGAPPPETSVNGAGGVDAARAAAADAPTSEQGGLN